MRCNAALRTGSLALLIVSLVWLAAFALSKFFFFTPWTLPALLVIGILFVAGACVSTSLRGPGVSDAARLTDQRLGLKERLSTACELDQLQDNSEVAALIRRDASEHLGKLTPSQLAPLHLPRMSRWVLLALACALIAVLLPDFHSSKRMQKQAEKETIKAQGERIELMVRRVEKNPSLLSHRDAPEDLKKMDEVAQRLSSGELSKTEALRELTKLTDDLKRREQTLASKDGVKPLDRESWRERESASPEQMQALQTQIDALQQKLGKTPPTDKQIHKLEQALKKAREAVNGAKLGTPEGQALADSLAQAANEADASQLAHVADELRKAIEALEGANVSQVFKHIDDAITDLDQAKQQVDAMKQLAQQAAKAGKDLAEQLERGQAKLAQKTLENFKKQVDAAQVTPEQKAQMAEELMKALGPSREYGKLSEDLRQAMQQARDGDQKGLSQSLQNAMDQLDKVSQAQCEQMQLAQMINELERAGVLLGMSNGQANGDGMCKKPGFGFGGKPGSGVGTWPDENGNPQYTDRWDNSGINRADMDSKGHTDRGPANSPQGTQNFSLKGNMGSGGPMPGISLQGISIKGQSNVKIEEAFSAASQEAENALSKETVPTSYQGAVKEYFDLK